MARHSAHHRLPRTSVRAHCRGTTRQTLEGHPLNLPKLAWVPSSVPHSLATEQQVLLRPSMVIGSKVLPPTFDHVRQTLTDPTLPWTTEDESRVEDHHLITRRRWNTLLVRPCASLVLRNPSCLRSKDSDGPALLPFLPPATFIEQAVVNRLLLLVLDLLKPTATDQVTLPPTQVIPFLVMDHQNHQPRWIGNDHHHLATEVLPVLLVPVPMDVPRLKVIIVLLPVQHKVTPSPTTNPPTLPPLASMVLRPFRLLINLRKVTLPLTVTLLILPDTITLNPHHDDSTIETIMLRTVVVVHEEAVLDRLECATACLLRQSPSLLHHNNHGRIRRRVTRVELLLPLPRNGRTRLPLLLLRRTRNDERQGRVRRPNLLQEERHPRGRWTRITMKEWMR